MLNAKMQTNDQSQVVRLKPLVLSCWPESGNFVFPEELVFSSVFDAADVAVSFSAQQNGVLRRIASDYRSFCDSDADSLSLRLKTYDLLVVFPLSLNSLAKFALGIQDSFPAKIFWKFSELGRPILLYEKELPDEKQALNPHLFRIYRQYWQQLVGGTVAGFNLDNLSQIAARLVRAKKMSLNGNASSGRIFITREDILEASQSLEPLKIPSSAILTDMALEEAEKLGVIIIRE